MPDKQTPPHHFIAYINLGRYNLCKPSEQAVAVRFHGLPSGLQASYVLGEPEHRNIHVAHDFVGQVVHEADSFMAVVEDVWRYIDGCLYNSERAKARELYLWAQINRERIEEQWYFWQEYDLGKQIEKLTKEHRSIAGVADSIREECANRVNEAFALCTPMTPAPSPDKQAEKL